MTLPETMNNPCDYVPHQACIDAAERVKNYIMTHPELREDADRGKMFGVLILPNHQFIAAYSGLLAGRNDWEWFVPPVFDAQQPDGHFKQEEREISILNRRIEELEKTVAEEQKEQEKQEYEIEEYRKRVKAAKIVRDQLRLHHNLSPEEEAELIRESQFMKAELHRMKQRMSTSSPASTERERLKEERRQRSEALQQWLFSQYKLLNYRGEEKTVLDIFKERDNTLPPAATGDCCAPKLLQYAHSHGLRPLQIAEFWWGESPKGEIRHHGQFYPSCRGRCLPLMEWMVPLSATEQPSIENHLDIIYEDEQIAVVSKPAGMLSVPGKTGAVSVYDIMRQKYPYTDSPLIVHRLDMATSGLLVIAKTMYAYHNLQKQFAEHKVEKVYKAILEGKTERELTGTISLPLRPDPYDRPRQVVDYEHGKEAITEYKISHRESIVYCQLKPLTGRTHQLRVHCAHTDGLGTPILGDTLYGSKRADRLYLHAEKITFTHPTTGERISFNDSPHWKE